MKLKFLKHVPMVSLASYWRGKWAFETRCVCTASNSERVVFAFVFAAPSIDSVKTRSALSPESAIPSLRSRTFEGWGRFEPLSGTF